MPLKRLILLPLMLACFGLVGCASLVTQYLQSASSFSHEHIALPSDIRAMGFIKREFCSSKQQLCMSYYSGAPITTNKLKYQTAISAGDITTEVTLDISRATVPTNLQGTVVLLHGFRASKEFMLNSALYFRFLGFSVLVPDLLGHGDSQGEKAFGVGDSEMLNQLIDAEHQTPTNLYLLGNSMGAVAALHTAAMRQDVSGIILQAPMLSFDEAVLRYAAANHPYIKRFFNDEDIVDGAASALREVNLTTQDTNVAPLIQASSSPILLFASSNDSVAPYSSFVGLENDLVNVLDLPNRNHPSMAIIGNEASEQLLNWLARGLFR